MHSFWFLALLLTLLPLPRWIQAVVEGYLLLYTLLALRAVYRSPWWQTVLKGLAVAAAYAVTLAVATLLIAGWALVA